MQANVSVFKERQPTAIQNRMLMRQCVCAKPSTSYCSKCSCSNGHLELVVDSVVIKFKKGVISYGVEDGGNRLEIEYVDIDPKVVTTTDAFRQQIKLGQIAYKQNQNNMRLGAELDRTNAEFFQTQNLRGIRAQGAETRFNIAAHAQTRANIGAQGRQTRLNIGAHRRLNIGAQGVQTRLNIGAHRKRKHEPLAALKVRSSGEVLSPLVNRPDSPAGRGPAAASWYPRADERHCRAIRRAEGEEQRAGIRTTGGETRSTRRVEGEEQRAGIQDHWY